MSSSSWRRGTENALRRTQSVLDRYTAQSSALAVPTAAIGLLGLWYAKRQLDKRPAPEDEECQTGWFSPANRIWVAQVMLGLFLVLGTYYAYKSYQAQKNIATSAVEPPEGTETEEELSDD
jgi:hypothetical protein